MGAPTAFSPFTFHFSLSRLFALSAIGYWLLAIGYSAEQDPASTAYHHPPNTRRHIGHGDEPMT